MERKDTTIIMAYLLETKSEPQKLCFTLANLLAFFSLFPKLLEKNGFSYPLAIVVVMVFCYFMFVAKN